MCLAVPARIMQLHDNAQATLDMMGVQREASVRLTPDAQVGDYVLVHAGFSIQVIDAQEAAATAELLRDLDELASEDLGTAYAARADGVASDGR